MDGRQKIFNDEIKISLELSVGSVEREREVIMSDDESFFEGHYNDIDMENFEHALRTLLR